MCVMFCRGIPWRRRSYHSGHFFFETFCIRGTIKGSGYMGSGEAPSVIWGHHCQVHQQPRMELHVQREFFLSHVSCCSAGMYYIYPAINDLGKLWKVQFHLHSHSHLHLHLHLLSAMTKRRALNDDDSSYPIFPMTNDEYYLNLPMMITIVIDILPWYVCSLLVSIPYY